LHVRRHHRELAIRPGSESRVCWRWCWCWKAGLLFVAANTGFLGGPTVLANMAVDSWVPRQFRNLSGRLVTQNGILS
jgi:hypothetical protein